MSIVCFLNQWVALGSPAWASKPSIDPLVCIWKLRLLIAFLKQVPETKAVHTYRNKQRYWRTHIWSYFGSWSSSLIPVPVLDMNFALLDLFVCLESYAGTGEQAHLPVAYLVMKAMPLTSSSTRQYDIWQLQVDLNSEKTSSFEDAPLMVD